MTSEKMCKISFLVLYYSKGEPKD